MGHLKLVVIGGGSSYTPELMDGIIQKKDDLPIKEVIFVEIKSGEEKVSINTALVKRMFENVEMDVKVSYTFDRKEALKGANFVLTQLRVGGLKYRAKDERIPLKYGIIGQETTGPGGFAKALRTIPVMIDICHDIELICPEAWLINFTNPAGIITEVIRKHTKVKVIGLCNVPIGMIYDAAEKIGAEPKDIYCQFVGLNHLSYVTNIYYKGKDYIDELVEKQIIEDATSEDGETLLKNITSVEKSDTFLRSLGMLTSAYLQYFYYEDQMFKEALEDAQSEAGTRAEQVMKVEGELFELYKNVDRKEKPKELEERGGSRYSEVAISLIDSIYNNKGEVHVVNTLNNGAIADLADDCVVEINCIVNSQGATPITYGYLPASIRGLIQQVKSYEQLTIEAAIEGNRDKALLALVANPLVHNVTQAQNILQDILEENKKYLPTFVG